MLDLYYSPGVQWDRLRRGPLGPHVQNFARLLASQGYPLFTGRWKLRLVAKLSRWLARRRFGLHQLDEETHSLVKLTAGHLNFFIPWTRFVHQYWVNCNYETPFSTSSLPTYANSWSKPTPQNSAKACSPTPTSSHASSTPWSDSPRAGSNANSTNFARKIEATRQPKTKRRPKPPESAKESLNEAERKLKLL